MRMQVPSLALLSGLRIQCCFTMVQAGSCSSNSPPSLGTSICPGCGPRKAKKKKEREGDSGDQGGPLSTFPLEPQAGEHVAGGEGGRLPTTGLGTEEVPEDRSPPAPGLAFQPCCLRYGHSFESWSRPARVGQVA